MILYCRRPGCQSQLEVGDSVNPAAEYVCREHTEKGEDKERFQEVQFDPGIGSGTDPRAYERGSGFARKNQKENSNTSKRTKDRLIKKIEAELSTHENKEEILRILQEDIRDSNSGVTRYNPE